MADDGEDRRVDEELLRYLSRILGRLDEVERTSLFPANRQESLVVAFDTQYYPDSIGSVQLELRAYTNGEFHVSYHEEYLGDRRHCRWDRHEQDHNSRDHFHPLPTASTRAAENRTFPDDLTDVLQKHVFPWVDQRLGELWERGE